MDINVKINKLLNGEKNTKAYASVTIDDAVVIHGIGVVIKDERRNIAMPFNRWTNEQGEEMKRDICHPISSSARKEIEDAVFKAYEEKIKEIEN